LPERVCIASADWSGIDKIAALQVHALCAAYEELRAEHKQVCTELRSAKRSLAHETALKEEQTRNARILAQDRTRLMQLLHYDRCGIRKACRRIPFV
jgi:hypothetical protein